MKRMKEQVVYKHDECGHVTKSERMVCHDHGVTDDGLLLFYWAGHVIGIIIGLFIIWFLFSR